jgi:hypothetical protein
MIDNLNYKSTWHNNTYPKGGVSYSKDSFIVNQSLVFQIKICSKSPALRVAAKRYGNILETPAYGFLNPGIFPRNTIQ